MYNNTSIVQDEILSHRLGLTPLNIDPRKVDWRVEKENLEPQAHNTVVFDLKVRCTKNPKANKGEKVKSHIFNQIFKKFSI